MQLSLIVAFCIVATVAADFNFAGSTTSGASFMLPSVSSGSESACTEGTESVQYQAFNMTLANPSGLYLIGVLDQDLSTARVLFYNSSKSDAARCAGLVYITPSFSYSGVAEEYVFLPAGTYTVFIAGTSSSNAGLFAVNVIQPQANGNNQNFTYWSNSVSSNSVTSDCSDISSERVGVATYTWTPTVTGVYDVRLTAFDGVNDDPNVYSSLAIFNGSFPSAPAAPGANLSLCTNGQFLAGVYDSDVTAISRTFLAGQLYTFALMNYYENEVSNFSLYISASRDGNTTNQAAIYNVPDRSEENCTLTGDETTYQNTVFTPQYPVNIINVKSSGDSLTFLYEGSYTVLPPPSCLGFIAKADTGSDSIAAILVPGRNYTVVVSAWNSGVDLGEYTLFIVSGTPLGVNVTTTTGSATTAGITTATTNGGSTTSSDDSAAVASVASLFLVAFAAVLAVL